MATQKWKCVASGHSTHIQNSRFVADVVLSTDQSPEKMGVADIVITGAAGTGDAGVAKLQIIFSMDGHIALVMGGEKSNIGFVLFAPSTIIDATKTNVTIMEVYIVMFLSEMERLQS